MDKDKVKNEADVIWNEIKDLPIDVYAVDFQVVSDHVKKVDFPGKQLYIKLATSGVLPALETTLNNMRLTQGRRYEVELGDGFVLVKRGTDEAEKLKEALKK